MSQVLVVGSDATYIRENFASKLAEHGVEIAAHWDWGCKPGKALPKGIAGVILFPAEAATRLTSTARDLARKADVPLAEVSRQFTQALPVLKSVGLVVNGVEAKAQPAVIPDDGTIYSWVLDYLRACPLNQNLPDIATTQLALRASSGVEDLVVADSVYKSAVAVVRPPKSDDALYKEVLGWCRLVIEDFPERPDDGVVTEVYTSFNPDGVDRDLVAKAVAETREALIAYWTAPYQSKTAEERKKFDEMRESWLVRYLHQHIAARNALPHYAAIRGECRRLFGTSLQDKVIKRVRARAEVLQAIPADATRVQVVTKDGTTKFRKPSEVLASDTLAVNGEGEPIVMKGKPGRKGKAEEIKSKKVQDALVTLAEVAALRAQITKLTQERDTARTAKGKAEETVEAQTGTIKKLQDEREGYLARIKAVEKQVEEMATADEGLHRENRTLQQQVDDLTEQNTALKNELEGVRRENGRLDKALADALGDLDTAEAAITRLTEEAKGRGLTLDDLIRMGCSLSVTPPVSQG